MFEVRKIAEHLRKYLLIYTLASILLALLIGSQNSFITSISSKDYSLLVEALAIATILPSMITLKGGELVKVTKMWRESLIALIYAYIVTPVLAWFLALLVNDKLLGLGYFISNIVPASSGALGYIMIASGNVELAAMLIMLITPLAILIIPGYLTLYSSITVVEVPITEVVESLVIVLLVPLLVGQLIRYYLLRVKYPGYVDKELKPYLSLATMLSMLILVFVLIARKTSVFISKPWVAVEILSYQTVLTLIMIFLLLLVNRMLGVRYREHQTITLITITKNQSVAAAIVTSSLSGGMAMLAPALIPAIQPVLAIIYLHLENYVKKMIG